MAEGARVLVTDRSAQVEAVAREIGDTALLLDVNEKGAGAKLAAAAPEAFGRLDALVNNAGIGGSRPLAESDDDRIDRSIDTNLKAVLRMTQDCLPHLARPGGRIINVSSIFGLAGYPGSTACAVAGVAQLTRQLACDLGPDGIQVNAVAPGMIETSMTADYLRDPRYLANMLTPTPLRRSGKPEEIASVFAFPTSDDASFVTGPGAGGGWRLADLPRRARPRGRARMRRHGFPRHQSRPWLPGGRGRGLPRGHVAIHRPFQSEILP